MARLGIASASNFSAIRSTARKTGEGMRVNYMADLIAERMSGVTEESFSNGDMDKGTELEPQARECYEKLNGVIVQQVGFVKLDDNIGCSPDGLVLDAGLIEIKCPKNSTHIRYMLADKMVAKYINQVQGQLWVTDRKWCDFISFNPRIESRPFWCIRVKRDEAYINKLAIDVNQFIIELEELTKKITQCPY